MVASRVNWKSRAYFWVTLHYWRHTTGPENWQKWRKEWRFGCIPHDVMKTVVVQRWYMVVDAKKSRQKSVGWKARVKTSGRTDRTDRSTLPANEAAMASSRRRGSDVTECCWQCVNCWWMKRETATTVQQHWTDATASNTPHITQWVRGQLQSCCLRHAVAHLLHSYHLLVDSLCDK